MFNISIVIGTRPEAIKLSPLVKCFKKSNLFKTRVVLTSQHKEMVDNVMRLFEISAEKDLNIMKHGQTLSYITSTILNELQKDFESNKPNLVIVQGDTTTSFAASLAAFYKSIPIAHVEAGLRTNSLSEPFPEEVNRRMISQMATLHFAPTEFSKQNLIRSGVLGDIYVTGNTVIDALLFTLNKDTCQTFDYLSNDKKILLVTVHRRENWGKKIVDIVNGLKLILQKHKNIIVVIPVHPNKKIRIPIFRLLSDHPQVRLIEPLNYLDLVSLINKSYLVMTDSGGLQEECPALGKPVLVLRDKTERIECIEANTAKLVGTRSENIFKETDILLTDDYLYNKMAQAVNPYGDGKASEKIVEACLQYFKV